MKHTTIIASIASLGLLLSANAMADPHYRHDFDRGYQPRARVVDVDPIYRDVRVSDPQRECWDQKVPRDNYHRESYTGTIAGGIIGGVLGNQFGGGSGKTVMTVAGTLLGGSIGHDVSHNRNDRYQPRYQYEQVCRTTQRYHHERIVDGYHVTYRYDGELYSTNMNHRPGKFIPVDVDVRPRHYR